MLACAASTLAASLPATPADASPRLYSRARLVDPAAGPSGRAPLPANRNFIFHYPFAATPCFLLNLGRPTKPFGAAEDRGRANLPVAGRRGRGSQHRCLFGDLRPSAHLPHP